MANRITTKEAVDHLRSELKKDQGYYFSWQSSIAVSFQNELSRNGYKLPDQHKISNDAAKSFLSILLADSEEAQDGE